MKEILKFKSLINNKMYFEAHEALEAVWFPIRKSENPMRLVLKGFINAAVSLELHKRGKIIQSKKIYKIYLKYVHENSINRTYFIQEFKDLKIFIDEYFITNKILN